VSSHVHVGSADGAANARSKSLNRNMRQRELNRITEENDALLKRLQEKTSCYNVIDWEQDRKKQVKMLKKICYYPPSLIKKQHRIRGKRRIDPNYEVFQFYQQNMKGEDSDDQEPGQYTDQPQPGEIREVGEDEEHHEDTAEALDNPYEQSQVIPRGGLEGISNINPFASEIVNSKNSKDALQSPASISQEAQ
jgi:hypothetical protein